MPQLPAQVDVVVAVPVKIYVLAQLLRTLEKFLSEACLPRGSSPVVWWRDNPAKFPLLGAAAARYTPRNRRYKPPALVASEAEPNR